MMQGSCHIRTVRVSGPLLLLVLLMGPGVCWAQADRSRPQTGQQNRSTLKQPRPPVGFRRSEAADPFQSLLKFVREEQEIEFAKPLPAFAATVMGAQAIEQQAQASYPSRKELAVYSLDWETSLAAAKQRAQAEKRPIFFIVVTNYSGPTNFFSGHC